MPALITHDFFGQEVYDNLFRTIGGTRDEAEAFLLGNQGPDPLFYSIVSPNLREHNRLGGVIHKEKPSELLKAFKDSLTILDEDELPLGRAYALGFLCHYTLDSAMHPFVYFHEYQLCDAGEPGLTRDDDHEVHATIESELDELVLFSKRGITVADFDPSIEVLKADDFVLDTVSKMYTYVALTVYGRIIPQSMFATSVRNFRSVQHLFYSPSGRKRAIFGRLERLVRPFSFYQSMSHRPVELTESIFDNHEHASWENPHTGTASTKSFWDLFDEARIQAKENIALFDRDNFSLDNAREITHELDFSGRPVIATLVSVEDHLPNTSPARGAAPA